MFPQHHLFLMSLTCRPFLKIRSFQTCQMSHVFPNFHLSHENHWCQTTLTNQKYQRCRLYRKIQPEQKCPKTRMYQMILRVRMFLNCHCYHLTHSFHGFPQNPKSLKNLNYRLSRRSRMNQKYLPELTSHYFQMCPKCHVIRQHQNPALHRFPLSL